MAKIAFIGAGSWGFTRNLVRDVLTFDLTKDATIVLMDIDKERLEFARKACQSIVDRGNYPARIVATLDRKEALRGADAVIITILSGGVQTWKHDILIPKKYGIDTNIGDTRSISGIFRALRTIPIMLDIVKDCERLCPGAVILNYSNPMAMLCRAMQRESEMTISGLCHSVQGTADMLARWIGTTMEHITYVCAGVNHQAFYLEYKKDGKDAYPLIRKSVLTNKKVYNEEVVRNEMFMALGFFPTESSGHNSEYNWWFRKRPDLIKKYCEVGTSWNPGVYGFVLKRYLGRQKTWKQEAAKWFELQKTKPMDLKRGHEYASCIINSWLGGELFKFNGNVPNTKLIDNIKEGACVEVPVVAGKRKLNPVHVGPLPQQLAALVGLTVSVEEMAVEASLTGDPTLVYQACIFDPLCAAVLSLREIRKMVDEMMTKNKAYLPQFKKMS